MVHSTAKRNAIASTNAGTKASVVQTELVKFGRKTIVNTTTTGITTARVSSLNVRLLAMCWCIGWTGRTRSGERFPCLIQYSISHMIQVNDAWETTSAVR